MNAQIYAQLKDYMGDSPYHLNDIVQVVGTFGSTWSKEQIQLLLICREEVKQTGEQFCFQQEEEHPLIAFLLKHAGSNPMPARYLLQKLPSDLTTSEGKLCQMAKEDPRFEVVRRTFIKKI